jgi:hypothetical protein
VCRKAYPGTQTLRPLEERQFQGVVSRQRLVVVIIADPIQRLVKLICAYAEHLNALENLPGSLLAAETSESHCSSSASTRSSRARTGA